MNKQCKKSGCNNIIDEKDDPSVFYCDECLVDVSIAVQKISNWIDSL